MTKKISFVLALLAGSVSFAQQAPAPAAAQQTGGLLGKRYAQLGFSYADVNHSSVDAFSTGVSVNLPVTSNIDVSASFTEAWVEGNSKIDGQAVDLSATYFLTEGDIKPFGTVSLGYNWPDLGDELTWGTAAGLEYAVNTKIALVGSVGYDDNFKSHNEGSFDGTVAAHYWFTDKIGAKVEASLIEGGNTAYAAALSYKF